MLCYNISKSTPLQDDILLHPDVYMTPINNIKVELNDTKSKLDNIYEKNTSIARRTMLLFDIFNKYKKNLTTELNTSNITNAWIKAYELISTFDLIPECDDFVYFDNASFPGSFVLALHHFIKTQTNIKNFKWFASSMLPNKRYNKCLKDTFYLYRNYKKNWMMHAGNDGDITKWENLEDIKNQLSINLKDTHSVDLYSCDLGIDVYDKFNDQEILHQQLNISQIVCGLMNLRSGGCMFVKHYTLFEIYTISYLAILSELFTEVFVTKPMSSKRTNSETYLVCRGYLYPFNDKQKILYEKLINAAKNYDGIPLLQCCDMTQTIESMNIANHNIFQKQINSLNEFISMCSNKGNTRNKNLNEFERNATNLVHNSLLNNNIRNHVNTYNKNCIKKYTALKLLPIQNKDKLSILS